MADSFEYLIRRSEGFWEKAINSPLGKLKLADAYLARIDLERDPHVHAERVEHLRGKVAELIRVADPSAILADFHLWRLVLRLFSAAGLRRLELRSKESIAKAVA